MPRVKLSKPAKVLMVLLQFHVVVLFALILVRFLKLFR